jgi:hypothetical protein
MTALDLFLHLCAAGCQLSRQGETLRAHDPQHVLTDNLRQQIREHKQELLRLLAQTTPACESPLTEAPILRQSVVLDSSSQHIEELETCSVAWGFWEPPDACYACGTMRRWRSIYGAVVCVRCHPPPDVAAVAAWEGDVRVISMS